MTIQDILSRDYRTGRCVHTCEHQTKIWGNFWDLMESGIVPAEIEGKLLFHLDLFT